MANVEHKKLGDMTISQVRKYVHDLEEENSELRWRAEYWRGQAFYYMDWNENVATYAIVTSILLIVGIILFFVL